jgi:hypothetical protein
MYPLETGIVIYSLKGHPAVKKNLVKYMGSYLKYKILDGAEILTFRSL